MNHPSSSSSPPSSTSSSQPILKSLILDAAPLLTQQPSLTDPILSEKYYLPPLVLEELKDERSRQYYQSLKTRGLHIAVVDPPPEALARVIEFSKKTGDYAVLSPPDLSVLALAYSIEVQAHGTWRIRDQVGGPTGQQKHEAERLRLKKAAETASSQPQPQPQSQSQISPASETSPSQQQSLDSAIDSVRSEGTSPAEGQGKSIREGISDGEGQGYQTGKNGVGDGVEERKGNGTELVGTQKEGKEGEIQLERLSLNGARGGVGRESSQEPEEESDGEDRDHVERPDETEDQDEDEDEDEEEEEKEVEVEVEKEEESEEIDSEDDEINGGEWITSENLSQHQARSLGLIPAEESSPEVVVPVRSDRGRPSDVALKNQDGKGRRLDSESQLEHERSTSGPQPLPQPVPAEEEEEEEAEEEEGWEVAKTSKKSSQKSQWKSSQRSSNSHPFNSSSTSDQIGPGASGKGAKKKNNKSSKTDIATLTSDYAVQNVLLQMGLGLVGAGGMRIKSVRSWVLRCHGCYKICKDSTRKFCPSCGNATLLRTSVTSRDPSSSSTKVRSGPGSLSAASSGLDLHLSKNFVYHNRGTKYSLPLPKPGSSSQKKGKGKAAGERKPTPILREDQPEWLKACERERIRIAKEERNLLKSVEKIDRRNKEAREKNQNPDAELASTTTSPFGLRYEDPDWMPEMLLGSKHAARSQTGLPPIGIGRKNPNERRRSRK